MSNSTFKLGFSSSAGESTVNALPVRGTVPPWLTGTLLRTAPAMFEVGNRSYNHWFDGLAMLHRFAFAGGQIAYASRYLQSRAYREAAANGRISFGEFATDPCRSLFGRVAAWFSPKITDNCNVSVNALAGETVALTETRLPIRFDPDTLSESGVLGHQPQLKGTISSAHPHFDAMRGVHYNYLLDFGRRSRYHLFSIDQRTGREAVVATVSAERPAYVHSFGMTERFLVFVEFPFIVNPLRLKFSGRPFIQNYSWTPGRGTRFHVIDKDTGEIRRQATGRPVFAFHHVNAFEEGDEVVVDVVGYPDAGIIDQLYLDRLRSGEPLMLAGELIRFRVGSSQDARDESLSPRGIEFPRIDYRRRAGRPYRYIYCTANEARGDFLDKLAKVDLQRESSRSWHEERCYPGEPVFVAAPEPEHEDDGVLLSVVLDAERATSFLLILDASNLAELARAEVPRHITFGLHGNYFDGASAPDLVRNIHW